MRLTALRPQVPELVVAAGGPGLCVQINSLGPHEAERRKLLMQLFASGGETASITSPFFCDYGSNIELGENVYFNFNCVVLDVCPMRIGAHTLFGPAVQIYTALHPMDPVERRKTEYGRPVEIGSDVWVGGAAVILPGVRIGSRSVIGAGSVVTRDVRTICLLRSPPGDRPPAELICRPARRFAAAAIAHRRRC
jgi:maltose O-acetyltransferase